MTKLHPRIRRAVRLALASSAAMTALSSMPAAAQDQDQGPAEEALSTVVVTGTRVYRPDYEGSSPVMSVSSESLKSTGTVTIEQLVNTLPQVVPHMTSTSNNPPGQGEARIDLRGLGTERNIILVDGIRMTPSNSGGIVDVNTIPSPLLERIDVVSGGASAVYGADAVSGAVNFILKDDFEGVEINSQYGLTEKGDGEVMDGSLLIGGNFADDGGNAVVYANYSSRDGVDKGDRDFTAQASSTTSYFPMGAYFGGANGPSQAALNQVFAGYQVAAGAVPVGSQLGFNDDGTLFSVGNAANSVVQNFRDPIDINVASAFFPELYSYNFEPLNKLVMPLERTSLGGMVSYDMGGNTKAYARVFLTNYNAESALAAPPTPTANNTTNPAAGSFFTIPVTNPFISADLRTLLNSRTGDSAALPGSGAAEDFLYRKRFTEMGARIEAYEKDVYQVVGGFKGSLPNQWQWDLYYANGRFNQQINQKGNVRVSAVEALLDAPDGGASLCAGGLNPFGNEGTLSPECVDFLSVGTHTVERLEQNLAEATISGDLFTIPTGPVGFAFGVFRNAIGYDFEPDDGLRTGDVAGFNAQDEVHGDVHNNDAYVEFLIPLVADKPMFRNFDLSLGYRYSDHSNAGGSSSYKGELSWAMNDAVRIRGGYQRAVRAPNIGELFQPQFESNPEVVDPCNFNSSVRTGPNAAAARDLCLAQGVPVSIIDTYSQTTAQIESLTGGNPDLAEEEADTYTLGLVWRSTSDSDYLSGLQASVDVWQIEVAGAIASIDPTVTVNRCFNENGSNPAFDNTNFFCQLFAQRDSIGQITDLLEIQQNLANLKTSGVDLQFDWSFPLGESAGQLGVNLVGTWVNEAKAQELPGDPFLDYAGTIGTRIGEARPEYKGTLTLRYGIRDFSTALRTRYIDAMTHKNCVTSSDPACGTGATNTSVDETYYLDFMTQYNATESLTFRAGVDNLTDQSVRAYTPNVQSTTDPSVYDVLGRKWFVNATMRF
jgi:iron complex outermembrane receptor protein